MTNTKGNSFWLKEVPGGGTRYRTRTKVLLIAVPLLLAFLTYKLLTLIEGLAKGSDIIIFLAYGILILVIVAILLIVVISIIEYLRRFE